MNWYKIIKLSQVSPQQEQSPQDKVHECSAAKFQDVKARLEKLNLRAKKLNLPPLEIIEVDRKIEKQRKPDRELDPTGQLGEYREYDVEMVYFQIKGTVPKVNGWKFIARIMHVSEEGMTLDSNIIKAVPGEEVPEKYRKSKPDCEHCHQNRKRNDTFILQNEQTGEYKQIGRTCLADFLRSSDPIDYVRLVDEEGGLMQFIDADEEGDYGFGGGKYIQGINIEDFVVLCMAASRKFGWVSRKKAREEMRSATVDLLWNAIFGKSAQDAKTRAELHASVKGTDKDTAKKAVEWARGLKDDTTQQLNDYLWNLSAACSNEMVVGSISGIIASLPVAYEKMVLSKETQDAAVPIPYKVGDKIEADVTIMKKRSIESMYGASMLHTMQDDQGIIYKWFASNEDVATGLKIRIKGTVKGIGPDKYENNKEVVTLTRCKVVHVFAPKEETQAILDDKKVEEMTNEIKKYIPTFSERLFEYGDTSLADYLAYDISDKEMKDAHANHILYGEIQQIRKEIDKDNKYDMVGVLAEIIKSGNVDVIFGPKINEVKTFIEKIQESQDPNKTSLLDKCTQALFSLEQIKNAINRAKTEIAKIQPIYDVLKKHYETKNKYGKWKLKQALSLGKIKKAQTDIRYTKDQENYFNVNSSSIVGEGDLLGKYGYEGDPVIVERKEICLSKRNGEKCVNTIFYYEYDKAGYVMLLSGQNLVDALKQIKRKQAKIENIFFLIEGKNKNKR